MPPPPPLPKCQHSFQEEGNESCTREGFSLAAAAAVRQPATEAAADEAPEHSYIENSAPVSVNAVPALFDPAVVVLAPQQQQQQF